ncbi:lasso peptide biosynthesis PqqD family chaperone [Streptomyces palmae]|uniref:Lasso peptide biosynthesis PqqD family chaperone n=1 Tax=Streptomyces palmae TaxID=1701085 RepID=A0A4Z0H8T2_9ACTN|nr:lasso peptide biosynthesis PqqD family chaperone [Streptomyces palmae]TGB07859.1 lasso peptide biosynthesis PqqD family chaperone [Streptomyces palmae]
MSERRFTLCDHIALTETAGGAVLLNQRTGQYWQLNATATLLARTLRRGATAAEAAAALAAHHPAAADRAAADVTAFLTTLTEAGALTPARTGKTP